ncbi:MAG TPA: universal stress protein, partial [Verrucomicrobiae bacterium]|nr:universal stress protein [Verrucomicrobiae bacterium]
YSGLARVLLGSTAERVVRHALCPVLVVRRSDNASPETRPPKEVQISFRAN